MELAIRPARFSFSHFATCTLSIRMDETCTDATCGRRTSGGRASASLVDGRQGREEGRRAFGRVVKTRVRMARRRPWLLHAEATRAWLATRAIGPACRPWRTARLCARTAAGRSHDVRTLRVEDADDHTAPSDPS